MNYKTYIMTITKIITTVLITMTTLSAFAQYTGGQGRGDHMAQSLPLIMSVEKHEQPQAGIITLYPVPARQMLNIKLNPETEAEKVIKIQMFDPWGKEVITYQSHVKQIPVQNLASGVYFLRFTFTSGPPQIFKIMVAKT